MVNNFQIMIKQYRGFFNLFIFLQKLPFFSLGHKVPAGLGLIFVCNGIRAAFLLADIRAGLTEFDDSRVVPRASNALKAGDIDEVLDAVLPKYLVLVSTDEVKYTEMGQFSEVNQASGVWSLVVSLFQIKTLQFR